MNESQGAVAYRAIFEGNGESLMTRMKVAETRIEGHEQIIKDWRAIAIKLLTGGLLAFLGAIAQIMYHVMSK